MMRDLLTISFLATFVATGASLSCEICKGFGGNCMGPLHVCSPGFNSCGIIQEQSTMGPCKKAVVKTCFPVSDCGGHLTIINVGRFGTLAKKLTCCAGDECMKAPSSLSPINTSLNGKKCPACYSTNSFTCQEEVTYCAGDELYCFVLAGTTTQGGMAVPTVIKGCANRAFCNDTLHGLGSFGGMNVVTNVNCTPASGTASSIPEFLGVFFQAFSGILLRKIFS